MFIEDENGTPVNGFRATEIRGAAYRIFHELVARNIAPLTWGTIRSPASKYYHREMNAAFPILGLCTGRWKAERLASKIYSSWYSTHKSKATHPLKLEDNELANIPPTQKRSRANSRRDHRRSSKSPRKKAKIANEGASTGDLPT